MIAEFFRPIVSGILGAIGAEWLSKRWRHWMPTRYGQKSKGVIMQENAGRIRIASWLALIGALTGVALYLTSYLSSSDWRGLGVAVGLAAGLPVLWLVASSIGGGGRKFQEGLVALAIAQKTPIPIIIGLYALCVAGGIVTAVSLILNPPSTSEQMEAYEPGTDPAPPASG